MRLLPFIMIPLILSACVEPQQYANMRAIGGDKEQGVMQMSVTYAPGSEQLNWSQAHTEANRRCMAWGFAGALPFEDTTEQCTAINADGTCAQLTVTRTYQCSVVR
ncbi:MAG: hypothetical protein KDJ82_12070 [Rhodobacteraceae bacterium]|nr:hypothetical protein [Paracoccaceae bacterium]